MNRATAALSSTALEEHALVFMIGKTFDLN
jgi:hypothetical protein